MKNVPLLLVATLASLTCVCRTGADDCARPAPSARELAKMTPCELDRVFATGSADCLPVGVARGRVLYLLDAKRPQARARLAGVLWKGKEFFAGGEFINRWCGFSAGRAHAVIGPSWFDGRPAVILEYPPTSLAFSNTRDELRQVAPGVLLGRVYERCPCPRRTGYFVLEMACGGASEK